MEFRKLIVTVGASALGVEEAGKLTGLEPEYRPVVARLDDVAQLPTHWCGYEGVDAVILSTSRPEIYRKLAADSPQMQALDEWVRMGGRLVLCVGSQAEKVLAAGSPLRPLRPRPVREDGAAASDRGVGKLLRQPIGRAASRQRQRQCCASPGWPTCKEPSRPARPTCRW